MKKICLLLLFVLFQYCGAFAQPFSFSFAYSGAVQNWTVPPGVTAVGMDIQGAEGGQVGPILFPVGTTTPGKGGRLQCVYPVTPGTVLNIYVGQAGGAGTITGTTGGWNGGGATFGRPGLVAQYSGGGGGGASDVRIGGATLTDRVAVGGGGGGAGYDGSCGIPDQPGGDGGGLTGSSTTTCVATLLAPPYSYAIVTGATGGTQTAGGVGANVFSPVIPYVSGNPGAFGIGGDTGPTAGDPGIAGGGGGGYFGGGGGCWMGGGGGSSYADPAAVQVTTTPGYKSGDGAVTICVMSPIKGAAPLCTAQKLTLSDAITGGTWTSDNTAIATVDPATGVVTGVSAGIVNITYTVTTCATLTAFVSLVVTQSPLPVIGVDPLCMGNTATFADGTPGGYWTSSNTAAATIGSLSGTISSVYPGTAMITYHDPARGCYSTFNLHVDGISGIPNVCKGLTIPLVSSTSGGAWTSGDTSVAKVGGAGVTGIVTGIDVGTATISYSSPVCPSHIVVTVNPVAPNAGADSICQDGTGYVTNIIGGGTWTSNNPPVAKVVSGTGLVTGISSGTAIMSYLLPTGCLSKSMVTIIPPAPPITGFLQACPGGTSVLSDALPDGVWSSLNTSVATIDAGGKVTAVTADTVSMLYTIRPNCATYTTFLVNPDPFPITGRDTLCPGVTDTLFDKSLGGAWSTGTPTLDTIIDSTGILTSRLSGTALITYTLPTTCYTTKFIYIYPTPPPIVTYDPYSQAFYVSGLSATEHYGYQWYDSITGLIPHATSPTLAGTYPQWYFVEITDTLGCKARSALYHFDLSQLGSANIVNDAKIRMYPNPVSGTLYIESAVKVRAVISTVDGKIALQQADAKQLDMSRLANAMYFISLYDESGQLLTIQKLVKE